MAGGEFFAQGGENLCIGLGWVVRGGGSPRPQWFPYLPLHMIHIFSLREIFRTRSSGSVSFECSHVEFALAGKATTEGDVLLINNSTNHTFKHNSNHTSEGAILLQKNPSIILHNFIKIKGKRLLFAQNI